jgi:Uncharacterized protein conserved in bacteria (DUF2066)
MTARRKARHGDNTFDPERFAMLLKRWSARLGSIVLLGALCVFSAPAAAQSRFDVFTIAPVHIDVTAASASAARDQALIEGERHGLQMLIERLTLASGRSRLPQPNNAQLSDLVEGFEVANERRSGVRYIADYTFHFRPDSVRQLLNQAGIAFAETPSKPLVVLAVLVDGDRPVLWDDPNPWREAWAHAKLPPGLVPLVIPLGEINDVTAIDADGALHGDDARLSALSRRYDGDDVLVTTATVNQGATRGLDVVTTRYTPGDPANHQTWNNSVAANAGENDAAMMTRALSDTMARVEEAWKVANILDARQGGTLLVRVATASLRDWIAVRDRLTGIPAVRSSQLMSIDRDGARVELHYVGDAAQLRLALAQRNLELSGSDPDWVLRQRAGGSAPR